MSTTNLSVALSWIYNKSNGTVKIKGRITFNPLITEKVIINTGDRLKNAVNVLLTLDSQSTYADPVEFTIDHPDTIPTNLNSEQEVQAYLQLISETTINTTLYADGKSSSSINVTTNNTGVDIIE
jgi:hypothetical protein